MSSSPGSPSKSLFAELLSSVNKKKSQKQDEVDVIASPIIQQNLSPDSLTSEDPKLDTKATTEKEPEKQPPLDDGIHHSTNIPHDLNSQSTTSRTQMSEPKSTTGNLLDIFDYSSPSILLSHGPPIHPLPREEKSTEESLNDLFLPTGDFMDGQIQISPLEDNFQQPKITNSMVINTSAVTSMPVKKSPSPTQLFPTIIRKMLEELKIDMERFYIPLEHITSRVLKHILQALKTLLDGKYERVPKRMRHMSCIIGVETLLFWVERCHSSNVQAWVKEVILQLRGDQQGPTGPLIITAINLPQVILGVQARIKSTPCKPIQPVDSTPQTSQTQHPAPYFGEVGYNQYLEAVYSPRNSKLQEIIAQESSSVEALKSPRNGLHVLISEQIYKHEFRPVSKHIPQFSTKKSSGDITALAQRRKKGTKYGNHKGKASLSHVIASP